MRACSKMRMWMIRSGLMGATLILRKGMGFWACANYCAPGRRRRCQGRGCCVLDALGGARGGTFKRWPVCWGGRVARLLGLLGLGFMGLGLVGLWVHGPC